MRHATRQSSTGTSSPLGSLIFEYIKALKVIAKANFDLALARWLGDTELIFGAVALERPVASIAGGGRCGGSCACSLGRKSPRLALGRDRGEAGEDRPRSGQQAFISSPVQDFRKASAGPRAFWRCSWHGETIAKGQFG
jgi:hypothetical protein